MTLHSATAFGAPVDLRAEPPHTPPDAPGARSMTFGVWLIALLVLVGCNGADEDENSWAHFEQGGIFATNSGTMSPKGDRIACSLPRTGHGDIYVVSYPGGRLTRLTTSECFEASPLFSPSSEEIYYVLESAGTRHIWCMNSDGTAQHPLTSGDVLDDLVEVSPDGRRILFERSDNTGGAGRLVTTYMLECATPSAEPQQVGRHARFGADGLTVVYVPMDSNEEIWELELRSNTSARIASGTVPVPSPTGAAIAFLRSPGTSGWQRDNEIWVVDKSTEKETRIDVGHSVCFLPDGTGLLFYQGYECKVRLYSFKDNVILVIDSPTGYKSPPLPCLDGSGCLVRIVKDDRVGEYYHYRKATSKLNQLGK